jgi:citrate synthase
MKPGLEDVIAAETTLSHVDGEKGQLLIKGYPLETVAGRRSFEWMTAHLWDGLIAEPCQESTARAALAAARCRAWDQGRDLIARAATLEPLEGLRLLLASLRDGDDQPHWLVSAACPVFLAALIRQRGGLEAVAPDAGRGHAEDFLFMLHGRQPDPAFVHGLETYLVAVCDHGLNASTFTARVIASTRAGLVSSVVGAVGALKGPLHGGAPGPVLDMLDTIGTPDRAPGQLRQALEHGDRLMGFGHRIYRVRDPRADVLKEALRHLPAGTSRLAFATEVERIALELLREFKPDRPLDTNVEFYTALLLEALGFPRDAFTGVFAAGRVIGWVAHALEQARTNRIIRPQSRYIGPVPQNQM